ncbi:hypothetical protein F4780DRAFT_777106 [Xylariomycetidae sp. FL0641]|nr:hypothetical protein F4780DRAFT_777106 [Xylariomycetidae sp. FL0641]
MTTKPSSAPWADEPFQLVESPSKKYPNTFHSYIDVATEMAHAHNVFIRGLNAIVQQAPHVPSSSDDNYKASDVKDLLFYVHAWVKMKFSGEVGIMDTPKHEHELFHGGMEKLLAYAAATKPEEYRWEGPGGLKEIIDSFAEHLMSHLYAEVDVLMGLDRLDSTGLRKMWDKAEALAKQTGNLGMLYDVFPCVLGTADKTYEGGNTFPPLPWVMPYLVKYWFAAGNGAWRFNPCDWWGQPRPLAFVPRS